MNTSLKQTQFFQYYIIEDYFKIPYPTSSQKSLVGVLLHPRPQRNLSTEDSTSFKKLVLYFYNFFFVNLLIFYLYTLVHLQNWLLLGFFASMVNTTTTQLQKKIPTASEV